MSVNTPEEKWPDNLQNPRSNRKVRPGRTLLFAELLLISYRKTTGKYKEYPVTCKPTFTSKGLFSALPEVKEISLIEGSHGQVAGIKGQHKVVRRLTRSIYGT